MPVYCYKGQDLACVLSGKQDISDLRSQYDWLVVESADTAKVKVYRGRKPFLDELPENESSTLPRVIPNNGEDEARLDLYSPWHRAFKTKKGFRR